MLTTHLVSYEHNYKSSQYTNSGGCHNHK